MNPSMEMPQYQCHKKVWALKIESLSGTTDEGFIHPENKSYAPFVAPKDWWQRCKATEEDNGYYVVYVDGYASWSPSKAFEDGYSLIK